MKKKTILFLPIEVGVAHITRSLAIAEDLHMRDYAVLFALPKRKQSLFAKTPLRTCTEFCRKLYSYYFLNKFKYENCSKDSPQ